MKRLSELPERDRTNETQQLMGDNPVKLLAATPTEDVLVKPEDLMAQITGGAGSSDAWARLEQIKEAYEKGPDAPSVMTNNEATAWLQVNCPNHKKNTSTFIYLPNSDVGESDPVETSGTAILPGKVIGGGHNYITLNNAGLDVDGAHHVFPAQYGTEPNRTYVYFQCNATYLKNIQFSSVMHEYNELVMNFPNVTSMHSDAFYFDNPNLYKPSTDTSGKDIFTTTILLPNLIGTGTGGTGKLGVAFGGTLKDVTINLYLPNLNTSFSFFADSESQISKASVEYLFNNINSAPTSGHILYVGVDRTWGSGDPWQPTGTLLTAYNALHANWKNNVVWVLKDYT